MESSKTDAPDITISVVPKEPDITIPVSRYSELLQASFERDAVLRLFHRSDRYAFRDNVAIFLGIPVAMLERTPAPQAEPPPAKTSEPPADQTGDE